MTLQVTFLGASGSVTGSKYLVSDGRSSLLVDCGMFQGEDEARNLDRLPVDPRKIEAVLLTHAHIDHIGALPYFKKLGLSCPIFCSGATADLAEIMLYDAAHLQVEECEAGVNHEPLFNEGHVEKVVKLFRPVKFHRYIEVGAGIEAMWTRTGHILGSGAITLRWKGRQITFSGDLGRYGLPILKDPRPVEMGDLLLIESTYGNRVHPDVDVKAILRETVLSAFEKKGAIVIPAFAVGRTQLILYYLRELKDEKSIPDIPVIVDSPMARDVTEIYSKHPEDYDEEMLGIISRTAKPFSFNKLHFIRDRSESLKLNQIDDAMIIIAGSGMMTGGRVLHHLKRRLPDPNSTVLLVGYQPPTGLGRKLQGSPPGVEILGSNIPVAAKIDEIPGLSAHADKEELLRWCRESAGEPRTVIITHGEATVAEEFGRCLTKQYPRSRIHTAEYLEEFALDN